MFFDFIQGYPPVRLRSVQPDRASAMPADKYIHQDSEMGIGMFDPVYMAIHRHLEVHRLRDASDAGDFRRFIRFDPSSGKLPEASEQAFHRTPRNQNFMTL